LAYDLEISLSEISESFNIAFATLLAEDNIEECISAHVSPRFAMVKSEIILNLFQKTRDF
jgi:hypothetical protein